MDPKPKVNHAVWIDAVRRMTPSQRLRQDFELCEFARQLQRRGLRLRYPHAGEDELNRLLAERVLRCSNQNF